MASLSRMAGGLGAAVLTGAALTVTSPAALAATPARVVNVPCSSPALAAAITAANTMPATLRLASYCTYNITTASVPGVDALPVITGNVALVGGPSTTITRDPALLGVRLLQVAGTGTLSVAGIFLLNGAPTAGLTGGAIDDAGALTLSQVTLSGNATSGANGGGVNVTSTGHALVSRTIISANTATGAGTNGGGINNAGSLTVSESRLSVNSATGGGGGLATQLGVTSHVIQSTLDHNTTAGNGGGILNLGTTPVDHTLIELNSAASGGGIFNTPPGVVTLSVSIVRNNTPNNCVPLNSIPGCSG